MNKDRTIIKYGAMLQRKKNRLFGRFIFAVLFTLTLFTFFAAGICGGQSDLLPEFLSDDVYSESTTDSSTFVAHAALFGNGDFCNTNKETGFTGWASASGESTYSITNRYDDANASCSISLSDGGTTFNELRNKGKLQCYIEVGSSIGHSNNLNDYGWVSRTLTWTGGSVSSGTWVTCPTNLTSITYTGKGYADGDFWHEGKCQISIQVRCKFRSADSTPPSVSVNSTSKTWEPEKYVTFSITDDVNASTNLNSKSCRADNGSNVTFSQSGTSFTTTVKITSSTGGVTWTVKDQSNNTTTKAFSLTEMWVDVVKPSISNVKFVASGGTTELTSPTAGTVDLICTVTDAESGVKTVSAYNNQTGQTYTSTVSGSTYRFSDVANGVYTISAWDKSGSTGNLATATKNCNVIDQYDPTVSVVCDAGSSTSFKKDAVTATFTLSDRAGKSGTTEATEKSIANACGDGYQRLRGFTFTVTGANSTTSSASATIVEVVVRYDGGYVYTRRYVGDSGTTTISPTYSQGVYSYSFTVSLPFSSTYSYTLTDTVGKVKSGTIRPYIDTSAPIIKAVTTPKDSEALGSFVKDTSVALTVQASDTSTTSGFLNQGSGLDYCVLEKYVGSASYSETKYFEGKTSVSFTLTKNYDEIQVYKITVFDKAGNSSDLSTASKTCNNKAYSSYFLKNADEATRYPVVFIDYRPVTVNIYGDSDCTQLYCDKDHTFLDQWRSSSSRTFYVKVTFGSSGGTLYRSKNGESETAVVTYPSAYDDFTQVASPQAGQLGTYYEYSTTLGIYFKTADTSIVSGKKYYKTRFLNSANEMVSTITVTDQGLATFTFNFKNQSTGLETPSGEMKTRLDYGAEGKPTATLLGFGGNITSSSTVTTESQLKALIADFIPESEMRTRTDWYNGTLNAYIIVNDTYSGVSGASQEYNTAQGVTVTQTSQAWVTVSFSHNGYTATDTQFHNYVDGVMDSVIFAGSFGNYRVLKIPLFNNLNTGELCDASGVLLYSAQKGGTNINSTGKLDLLWGGDTPFTYNITVHDFIGNATAVTNGVNSVDLSYKVDPFTPAGRVVSIRTADGLDYDCTPLGPSSDKWTRKAVNIVVEKTQMGLSPTLVEYGTVNIIDRTDSTGEITSVDYKGTAPSKWVSATTDSSTSQFATITMTAESRSVRAFFRVSSSGGSKQANIQTIKVNNKNENVCIRQDTQKPTFKAMFVSTDPNIKTDYSSENESVLLYYEAEEEDGVYTFRRIAGKMDEDVYSHQKVYLYILASDFTGVGLGSGIKYIKSIIDEGGTYELTEYFYTYATTVGSVPYASKNVYFDTSNPYNYLYRSEAADYGYVLKGLTYGVKLYITDNQNNEQDNIEVEKALAEIDSVDEERTLFPIVDTIIPEVRIASATYGTNNTSYLRDGRFDGSTEPICDSLKINFTYVAGISDAWIYIRQRAFGTDLSPTDPILVNNSDPSSNKYGFVTNAGIVFSSWAQETNNDQTFDYPVYTGWTYIGKKTYNTATGVDGKTWSYLISSNNASLKYRYDILVVNGAGVYYYMDGGDVYIDTVPPVIDNTKTFLALASDENNYDDEILYDSLTKINANNFTNDKVYAYYYVTDGASGVDSVTYSDANGTYSLEKVTLTREDVTYEKGDNGNKGDGYYRLLMTANQSYKIRATDLAKNYVDSPVITPAIDRNDISIAVELKKDNEEGYTSGVFTNSDEISVKLTIGTGSSLFKYVQFAKVDKGEEPTTWATITTESAFAKPGSIVISGVNTQTGVVSFKIVDEQNSDYYFRAYNGVTEAYAAYASYVEDEVTYYEHDGDGNQVRYRPYGLPMTSATYPVTIAIDRTAPIVNLTKGNFAALTESWHWDPQSLNLFITDPNAFGSGISEVKVEYTLGSGLEVVDDYFYLTDSDEDSYYNSSDKLDHYVNYVVKMKDEAGNTSSQIVLPLIDRLAPSFSAFGDEEILHVSTKRAGDDIYPDLEERAYTVGNNSGAYWTNMNVEALFNVIHGISGAKLYYRRVAGGGNFKSTDLWNEWGTQYNCVPVPNTDDGRSYTVENADALFNVAAGASSDYTYQIKIVSNAGRESEVVTIGRISIDKEKPVVVGKVYDGSDPLTTSILTEWQNDWTKNSLYVYLKTNSVLVSGYSFYYNLLSDDLNHSGWQKVSPGYTNTANFILSKVDNKYTFEHVINTTTNNENYYYYIESDSGMRSDVFAVTGIKIDTLNPQLDLAAEKSMQYGEPHPAGGDRLNVIDASYYTDNGDLNYVYSNPKWTSDNSVILRVEITKVNTSGLKLKINGTLYETIDYAGNENVSNNNPLYRYYVVSQNGKNNLTVTLETGAGKLIEKTAKIWIDNVIPALYVSGIVGDKSNNWDGTVKNSWYTSATTINFTVGTLVNVGGSYELRTGSGNTPLSSYTIEYATYENGQWSDWTSNGTNTMFTIIGNPYVQTTYRFRIKNEAGLVYELGSPVYDNAGSLVVTKEGMDTILTAASAVRNHLTDANSYIYTINVDSNTYYVLDSQVLTFINNGQTITVTTKTDFATYSYYLYKNGVYRLIEDTSDMEFKRGDRIRVNYATKTDDNYIHNYTDYGVVDQEGAWMSRDYDGNKRYADSTIVTLDGVDYEKRYRRYDYEPDRETTGGFVYDFTDSSLSYVAHFMKLLEVTYGNEILYKQSSSDAAVTADTRFTYKNENGANSTVGIDLIVSYATMSGTPVDPENIDLGAYRVIATVNGTENINSFRLKNPQTILLVKYFNETLDENQDEIPNDVYHPYSINDEEDLAYVSRTYYDSYTQDSVDLTSFMLGEEKSYLSSAYRLTTDLSIDEAIGISGKFLGSINGNGHLVTMTADVATDRYGFFEEFAGAASALVVELDNTLGVQGASRVGVFAAVFSGGRAENVRVKGDIVIVSAAADAMIGGFVGEFIDGQIGASGAPVFVDALVENRGNNVTLASIGGVAGYMYADAVMNYVYAYTFVTVYGVESGVKAGAVVGALESDTYGESRYDHFFNNRYLGANTFVNDVAVEGFAGTFNDVDYNESYNTVKAMTYANFVNNTINEGATSVVNKMIRNLILDRLYSDFGQDATAGYDNGTGGATTPFIINDVEKLSVVDKYMNVRFSLTEDLDLSGLTQPIGLHKVFNGALIGNEKELSGLGAGFEAAEERLGLFADLSGSVEGLVFTDVAIENVSSGTTYAGTVAAKLSGGTIHDVIVIGSIETTAGGTAYAGAIAGYAEEGAVYDAFSIVNVKVTGATAYAGSVLGYAEDVYVGRTISGTTGTVFALGRAVANSLGGNSYVDSVIGRGYVTVGEAYVIENNAYSNGVVLTRNTTGATMVGFGSSEMRTKTFSTGKNVFNVVFKSDGTGLYKLAGGSTADEAFSVRTAEDFAYIDQMLFAKYNIANDIEFENFRTIGKGLVFSGSINGKNSENWSAEHGTVSTLMNVTDALVDTNSGTISDFGVNVSYEITTTEDVVFGALANVNVSGTIRNVTVGGQIDIIAAPTSTVIVSGFIGIGSGGTVAHDNKIQNSISGLNIFVSNAGTAYIGGYIGKVDGEMTLTYGIGSGLITAVSCGNTYAGALVGAVYKDTTYKGVEATVDYRYTIMVDATERTDLFGYVAGDASTILHID